MIECFSLGRVLCKLIETEPHVHSLQELTTRLILKVLVGLIKEIDKQDMEVFRRREKIDVSYFRLPFKLDLIFLKKTVLCGTICSRLAMCEMFKLTLANTLVDAEGIQHYLREMFAPRIRNYQILCVDPILSCVADLQRMKIQEKNVKFLPGFVDFLSEKVFEEIFEKKYGPSKRSEFAEAMQCSFDNIKHRSKSVSHCWNKCLEDSLIFHRFNRCFHGEYQNDSFLIATSYRDKFCAKCCREEKLDWSDKTWLQISLWSILGCCAQHIFETLSLVKNISFFGDIFRCRYSTSLLEEVVSEELINENQKVKDAFCALQAQMIRCLNAFDHVIFFYRASNNGGACRNQKNPDFFHRESFLYFLIDEEDELKQFLYQRECEFLASFILLLRYQVFHIPQEKYMTFLPQEIIGNRANICLCHLMFDDFVFDKKGQSNEEIDMWYNLKHPIECTKLIENRIDISQFQIDD